MNPFDFVKQLNKTNPFREPTREERLKQKQREVEIIEGVKKLGIICNDIIRDQRYREFALLFKDIQKKIVDLMIDMEEADRDKYFLRMSELQIKLRLFRTFLNMPHEFVERAEAIKKEIKE
jgi:hypothetical protein